MTMETEINYHVHFKVENISHLANVFAAFRSIRWIISFAGEAQGRVSWICAQANFQAVLSNMKSLAYRKGYGIFIPRYPCYRPRRISARYQASGRDWLCD
jgi:hypothetical protein